MQFAKETLPISLEEEMRRSYLDYAMSVIVGRALPDARDGLKPVHRRALFAMHEQNNDWNRPFKKSARIVGDVMGKYHPHGDSAIYDTIVRMAQPFSLRHMLVDGQGNFGSVDGDNPAAMRYTEIRLTKIAHEMLADIDKETVDFGPNYDGSEREPLVLPSRIPNLLINGSSGIAVGMATNIPPHNLNEVVDACLHMLKHPDASIDDLMEIIPAPDFPTAGIIYGMNGVKDGYRTGRGRVIMRAKVHFEDIDKGQRQSIIVDELPYQVNKKTLQERIAELVNEKKIEGISHIQDESDKSGMRLVIELKRGEVPEVVLNNLYKQTQLQDSFGMNMVALIDGQPKLCNLKDLISVFLLHRREVVTRRTVFTLRKARDRGHVLEGLAVALANIDDFIALIRSAPTPPVAKAALMEKTWDSAIVRQMLTRARDDGSVVNADDYRPSGLEAMFGLQSDGQYRLSETQAQEILQMRLQRLTGLEQDKIVSEYREVMSEIEDLLDILAKPERVSTIIGDELTAVRTEFGQTKLGLRRSVIEHSAFDLSTEDLITPTDMVVTMSHSGYIKSQPLSEYRAQKRGGRGKQATATKEDDWIEQLFIANTHDYILCFSNRGRMYWLKVWEVPAGSRGSRGRPIVNMFPLAEGEKITVVLPVTGDNRTFPADHYIFMATSMGTVKKTPLDDFSNPRKAGIIAVDLDEGDFLIGAALTDGKHDVMLFSDGGKAVRFDENDVRPTGRNSRGVRGMMLDETVSVIAMLVAEDEQQSVLTATENGFGKRTLITEYTRHGRGTKGMIAIQQSERNGKVVAATLAHSEDEVMLITDKGVLVRTRVSEIREMGRATQGVTLMSLDDGSKLSGLQRIVENDAAVDTEAEGDADTDGAANEGTGRNARVKTLPQLRIDIDAVDQQLLALLDQRAALAHEVGEVKKLDGSPVFRPDREAQVIAKMQAAGSKLKPEGVAAIWREVMSACRALEETQQVAFLGPKGTYSEEAAIEFFGSSMGSLPCQSIDEVFRATSAGAAEFGVVPIENSTEGVIARTMDLLLASNVHIVGNVSLMVRHNLLRQSTSMDGITVVYGHPQALAQCQAWLSKHLPNAERRVASSNAEGARQATLDKAFAAIASSRAGAEFGLQTVAKAIQDEVHNRTRFAVICRPEVLPLPAKTGRDAVSLVVSVKNQPGALHDLLVPMKTHGVSMTRFESRPARSAQWEYNFYIDLVGHVSDAPVAAALAELQALCAFYKVLGCYPAAD